jgi:CubicO group peptidase (beta-lactamase class C family)
MISLLSKRFDMIKIAIKISILSFFLIYCGSAFAQSDSTPNFIQNDFDNYVNTAIQKWNVPGVAIAIVKDGKVVVNKGYGTVDMNSQQPVDSNTLFMIASNTKAFVGTSLAMLEHEGKCKLSDPVQQYVPEFRMHHDAYSNEVNIADLLSHRIGLGTFQGDFLYFYSSLDKKTVYEKFPLVSPNNTFRTQYGYCNAAYFWSGECIEGISEMTWDIYLSMNLLNPLEMNRTTALSEGVSKLDNVASAHTLQNGKLTVFPHTNIDVIGPAASMCSSVEDMSHWLIAQTDSGKYNGKQVIPYEVIQKTRYPQIVKGKKSHIFNQANYGLYGLGWELQDYEGKEIVSHTGGILGFVTAVAIVPEENLGICILTNTDENWLYEALKWEIIDAYLGLPKRNYSDLYKRFYDRSKARDNKRITQLQDSVSQAKPHTLGQDAFVGKYVSEVYGWIEIYKDQEGVLQLKFEHHPDLKAKLEYIADNRFLCSYYPSRMGTLVFPFTVEKDGVVSFELQVASRLEYTSYHFVKQ